jgi:hypothetical protein
MEAELTLFSETTFRKAVVDFCAISAFRVFRRVARRYEPYGRQTPRKGAGTFNDETTSLFYISMSYTRAYKMR